MAPISLSWDGSGSVARASCQPGWSHCPTWAAPAPKGVRMKEKGLWWPLAAAPPMDPPKPLHRERSLEPKPQHSIPHTKGWEPQKGTSLHWDRLCRTQEQGGNTSKGSLKDESTNSILSLLKQSPLKQVY